jgi:hypothetical protein
VLKTMTTPDEDPERRADGAATAADGSSPFAGGENPEYAEQFASSPRGARLARRAAVRCLEGWGYPPACDTSCTVALLVAELAANAVRHGRVPGREFRLGLVLEVPALDAPARGSRGHRIRVEVSDACDDRPPAAPRAVAADDESGRGLLLVDILATRWGTAPRDPVGKTVWADVAAEAPPVPWTERAPVPGGGRPHGAGT